MKNLCILGGEKSISRKVAEHAKKKIKTFAILASWRSKTDLTQSRKVRQQEKTAKS